MIEQFTYTIPIVPCITFHRNTRKDEMCNFYMMYSVRLADAMQLFDPDNQLCFSTARLASQKSVSDRIFVDHLFYRRNDRTPKLLLIRMFHANHLTKLEQYNEKTGTGRDKHFVWIFLY